MIAVSDALELVLSHTQSYGVKRVPLEKCIGRILGADVAADRSFPPFDRVMMDGIAIRYQDFDAGLRTFPSVGVAPAGSPRGAVATSGVCIEVMTGAPLPAGVDTVIRYEDVVEEEGVFTVSENAIVNPNQNIHPEGSDNKKGDILLSKYSKIKAIDVNVLATVGLSEVEVLQLPKIAVISSGDELVEVNQVPAEYQIRRSNVHMLQAQLSKMGLESEAFHFYDDSAEMHSTLSEISNDYDVIMMSGGVSKGKFDFVPSVLDQLGYQKLFHRVAQRPGKPMWFGVKEEKVVFAFPGNPVSTLACFYRYFRPWIYRRLHQEEGKLFATLAEDVHFEPKLTYYAQAQLSQDENATLIATVHHGKGSGDMVSPSTMDGFIVLPAEKEIFRKGEVYEFMKF